MLTDVISPNIVDPKIAVDQNGPPLELGDIICYTAWIDNTGDADSNDNPGTVISNQGTVFYDRKGNGTNDAQKPIDDPVTDPPDDPTNLEVAPRQCLFQP